MDDEQTTFSSMADSLKESSVEDTIVAAMSDTYETISADNLSRETGEVIDPVRVTENTVRLTDHTIPDEEQDRLVNNVQDAVRRISTMTKEEVIKEKAEIWRGLFQKNGYFTVRNSEGREIRPKFIDTNDISNNEFVVVKQFTYSNAKGQSRPDIVVLVNGLPVLISEVKSTASSGDAQTAINDIRNQYEKDAPELFTFAVAGCGVADLEGGGDDEYVAPLYYRGFGSPERFNSPWYDDWENEPYRYGSDAFASFTEPEILIEMLRYGQMYNTADSTHVVARHQQFFVARRIAADASEKVPLARLGDKFQELVVHVQGSGKTYAMLFAARWVQNVVDSDVRMLIVVDRDNLNEDVKDLLANIEGFGVTSGSAESTADLKRLLTESNKSLVLTTIQKLGYLEKDVIEEQGLDAEVNSLTDDTFVSFEDEVHREMLNKQGAIFQAAVPNIVRYGFTGTPTEEIVEEWGATQDGDVFFHEYSRQQALREGVTLPVEPEQVNIALDYKESELDSMFEQVVRETGKTMDDVRESVQRAGYSKFEEYWPSYREMVINHIVEDFRRKYEGTGKTAMVVCGSKKLAAQYSAGLQRLLGSELLQPLYSSSNDDPQLVRDQLTLSSREVREKFHNTDDPLQIIVVCEMLLTGFDAPNMRCMYLNRDISQEHTLLQAIARVNRPAEGKDVGRIIDYKGATDELEVRVEGDTFEALEVDKSELLDEYSDVLEKCRTILGFDTWESLIEEYDHLEKIGQEQTIIVPLLDDEVKRETYQKKFRYAIRLRERILPDERELKYEPMFHFMGSIYNKTSPDSERTGLAEIVGKAGGESMEEVIDLDISGDPTVLDITPESEQKMAELVTQQKDIDEITKKAKEIEREFGETRFSERVEDLYSQWKNGSLSNERVEQLEKDLSEYSDSGISTTAKQIQNLAEAEGINLSKSEASELEAKINKLHSIKPHKTAQKLFDSYESEHKLKDFTLLQDIVETVID